MVLFVKKLLGSDGSSKIDVEFVKKRMLSNIQKKFTKVSTLNKKKVSWQEL